MKEKPVLKTATHYGWLARLLTIASLNSANTFHIVQLWCTWTEPNRTELNSKTKIYVINLAVHMCPISMCVCVCVSEFGIIHFNAINFGCATIKDSLFSSLLLFCCVAFRFFFVPKMFHIIQINISHFPCFAKVLWYHRDWDGAWEMRWAHHKTKGIIQHGFVFDDYNSYMFTSAQYTRNSRQKEENAFYFAYYI